MEKIKFRGRDKSGEYHYGGIYKLDFDDGSSRCAIIEQIYEKEIEKAVGIYYLSEIEVEPESVAQFVGYDSEGKEVYEGDICKCEELGECFIALSGYSVPGYLPLNSKEIEWYLKE